MSATIQVEPSHYRTASYDSQQRFMSYWHQIDEIRQLGVDQILEVGIGNGYVSDYLKKRGLRVTTADVDCRLAPDVVATVEALPFHTGAFDGVACFEVLEHLPYEVFRRALAEVGRVTRQYLVVSLPDASDVGWVDIRIGAFGVIRTFRRLFSLPRLRARTKLRTADQHHWEIAVGECQLAQVIEDLQRCSGCQLVKTYRADRSPYHRFFVLRKKP